MTTHAQPTGRCLHCPRPVYDHAALCPACETRLDDAQRAAWLDALIEVRREPMRKQRGER